MGKVFRELASGTLCNKLGVNAVDNSTASLIHHNILGTPDDNRSFKQRVTLKLQCCQ